MGQGIVYCFRCSSRIVGAETDKGAGFAIGDRFACADCASALLTTLSPAEREALLAKMLKSAPGKTKAPTKRTPRRGTEIATPSSFSPSPKSVPTAVIVVGTLLALSVALVAMMTSGSSKPVEPTPVAASVRPPPPPPRPDPVKPRESYETEWARIDDSVAGVVRQENFKEALDYLASARKRHDASEWTVALDRRIAQTLEAAKALYVTIEAQALESRRRGMEAELKAIQERVARWRLPDFVVLLQKALEAAQQGAFRQGADGIVCFEAEHFELKTEVDGHGWSPVREPEGFEGQGAMSSLPNSGLQIFENYAAKSPRLEYRIEFLRTGPHYLWIRACAPSDKDNSVHAGLDGEAPKSLLAMSYTATKKWVWTNRRIDNGVGSFQVPKAGVHTFQIWIREDGATLDRFVVTSDPKWTPKGNGPAESSR